LQNLILGSINIPKMFFVKPFHFPDITIGAECNVFSIQVHFTAM